uniref:Sterile alpha motif domain containing 11 n=1 Tax=Esox lucius TaxID=8010 RepID=A0A6Q2ZE19_ESOLU
MSGIRSASPIKCGSKRGENLHASGGAVAAESAATTESWKLVNGNLSGKFNGPLSQSDTAAQFKTKWRVFMSGAADQLRKEDTQVESDELLITCYRRFAHSNMPAIKKERLDGDDMALGAFNQSEYLAPLNATAIPVVTPHPPPYEHIFPHHRAYFGLHDSTLHHQHLHHHPDDLMLERFSSIPDFQPFFDNGEPCIEVECGENKALLYINKLCQGSKGPSIKYRGEWLTPNEFQFVSGRETAKDWKRSIRHKGKSLKTLMSKGILQVHPPICDCPGCRISSPVNRGRLAEKRTIPLPPNRVPKRELASVFSSDDSEGSDRASGDHAHIKQEEELHYSIMRKRRQTHTSLTDLSVLTDDLLGKRRAYSPNSSSECLSDSKKSRSVSPKENSHTPVLEGGSLIHMTPEEHYRRMMSALNEQGSYEEQQQRLYQLANNMGLPHHDLLRMRQDALAAVRNAGGLEAHLPSAGSSSSQRRKQGLPQHRDAHYTEREMSHPPPLLSPQNAPHIALGPHLRPPFLGLPSALCQTPGYGFLQPAQAEMFARQQEMLRKQNLARLEMSAELLRHKELESLQRQQHLPLGLPPDHPALRSLHHLPEGHPLHEEFSRRQNAMLVLRHTNTPLLSLNLQGPSGATLPKDTQAQGSGNGSGSRKGSRKGPQQPRGGEHPEKEGRGRDGDAAGHDNDMKDSDSETEMGEDRAEGSGGKAYDRYSDVKYHFSPSAMPPLPGLHGPSLPFGFPYTSPYFHTGGVGGLFMDDDDSAAPPVEDISKWSVEDVCGFVGGLAGCAEYTQVFREQAIDGDTLPLLTEEHLLNTMGLKLGPALKIRSQVARRVGRLFYMTSFPLALPLPPSGLRPTDRDPVLPDASSGVPVRPPSAASSSSSPYRAPQAPCRTSPKQENSNNSASGSQNSLLESKQLNKDPGLNRRRREGEEALRNPV